MDSPKVFEYAKSIGMETLALMDKLREWNVPVKSHMAELDPETIHLIEQKFAEAKVSKEAAPPKKTTRKTAAPKAASSKEPASETKATKPKPAAKKAAPAAKREAAPAKGAAKVIRRKASDLQAKEEEAQRKAEAEAAAAAAAAAAVEAVEVAPAPEPAVAEEGLGQEIRPEKKIESDEAPALVAAASVPAPAAPEPAREVPREAPRITRSVKKEVVPGTGKAPSSSPSNIIGRIDLNRQQQQPRPQRPQVRPSTVRTGFIQQQQYPTTLPEEHPRREERKRRPTARGPGARGPGPAEQETVAKEEEVVTFDPAEFKKRELVFQPKKKKATLSRPSLKTEITTPKASKRIVKMYDKIKVADFAKEMGVKASQIVATLMKQGMTVTMNDLLDFDTATLIAPEFQHEVENLKKTSKEVISEVAFGNLEAARIFRSPVVTVMGHVDHGKTSLLDAIRSADVAAGEAGGITQHIGAYKVKTDRGVITFIDTPGHEAFTAMRARGANVTDIVILVVAADDGVMQQTAEAVNHAKNAGVPIIVAINKMDKPGANLDRVKQQMTEFELVAEEWGGQTAMVPVSAIKKTGIKELLEQVILQSEIMELKANAERSATGVVLESRVERGRGVVATVLVKDGTMKLGQFICAGQSSGRVRAMFNDRGEGVKEAGPADPVEVLGLNNPPLAGDMFDVCKDERAAEELAAKHREEQVKQTEAPKAKVSLEDLFGKIQTGDMKELPIVLKCDVVGSMEALKGLLEKASTEKVKVKIVHSAVGGISESDVLLASSSKGIIIGFNTRPEGGAANLAKSQGVEIKSYSIVYEVVDDIKKAMAGLLDPTFVESTLGRAEVRNVFTIPKIGAIAGSYVVDGKIIRSASARLVREGRVIYEGRISSLKRFKDDAREVATGFECGIGIENYNDVKVGDVIEAFETKQIEATL